MNVVTKPQVSPFEMVGGRLCLDFTNTVTWTEAGLMNERLTSYARLVDWARRAGVLPDAAAARLAKEGERHPQRAARTLERAHALRATLHQVFSDVAHGHRPDAAPLEALNVALAEALSHLRLRASRAGGFEWEWVVGGGEPLAQMLWPVARSAADVLTSAELRLVRDCANDACGWLFLDESRNRSRRWCDMNSCGNRAKARRHYARRQGRVASGER